MSEQEYQKELKEIGLSGEPKISKVVGVEDGHTIVRDIRTGEIIRIKRLEKK